MKKKQGRTLTKFTSAETNTHVWLDLSEVIGVEADVPVPDYMGPVSSQGNFNPSGQMVSTTVHYNYDKATRITLACGSSFLVKDHYLEVLALVEGRNPAAAQIIYGQRKNP